MNTPSCYQHFSNINLIRKSQRKLATHARGKSLVEPLKNMETDLLKFFDIVCVSGKNNMLKSFLEIKTREADKPDKGAAIKRASYCHVFESNGKFEITSDVHIDAAGVDLLFVELCKRFTEIMKNERFNYKHCMDNGCAKEYCANNPVVAKFFNHLKNAIGFFQKNLSTVSNYSRDLNLVSLPKKEEPVSVTINAPVTSVGTKSFAQIAKIVVKDDVVTPPKKINTNPSPMVMVQLMTDFGVVQEIAMATRLYDSIPCASESKEGKFVKVTVINSDGPTDVIMTPSLYAAIAEPCSNQKPYDLVRVLTIDDDFETVDTIMTRAVFDNIKRV